MESIIQRLQVLGRKALPELAGLSQRCLTSLQYRSRIRALRSNNRELCSLSLDPETVGEARRFLNSLSRGYRDLRWHQLYTSLNGISSAFYMPEDLFFSVVEKRLNPPQRSVLYLNKNLYDSLGIPGPKTLARIVRGRLVDSSFRPLTVAELVHAISEMEIVLKPSFESGGGKGISFIPTSRLETELESRIGHSKRTDYILQAPVRQSRLIAALNPSSVNTYRIMTIRLSHGGIRHVSSILRCGRNESRVDNREAGGIACGVQDGRLIGLGADRKLSLYERHPDSGIRFKGYTVPSYPDALDLCLELHGRLPDMDIVSWDVAITEDNTPIIIEFNLVRQGIGGHQICNGPVFEPYSDFLERLVPGRTFFGITL